MSSIQLFLGGMIQLLDDNGDPLAGGKVYFYEPGTTTLKDTYTSSDLSTANSNPVVLDANGRATVYLSGNYKVKVTDSADVTIYTQDNINPVSTSTAGNYNFVTNGSFEDNTLGDNKTPDGWTLTEESGSTVTLDTTDQQHGAKAMKFTSTGSGGGNIISENFFEVNPNRDLDISYMLKSTVVDVRNVVEILWYDENQASVSTTTLLDDSTTNPTSWTKKEHTATPPSTARYAKIRMYGCHPSDATTGSTWYDDLVVSDLQQPFAKGADIASAATLSLGNDGNYFDVTGTTAITSISSKGIGSVVKLHFDDALTLTHHATNLILPSGANITTVAGDEAEFIEYASGDWRCTNYTKTSGEALVQPPGITLGTEQATTSGTSIDFTGIPSGTKRVTVMFDGVSTSGTSPLTVQLGDSGGIETSGYKGTGSIYGSSIVQLTSGFQFSSSWFASFIANGKLVLDLEDETNNTWVAEGGVADSGGASNHRVVKGSKSLTGKLDRIRITTAGGTDTVDAGAINISYE